MAVVAPTGVAAINAGGVTIHSFFQLPFSPFVPESKGFSKDSDTVNAHGLTSRLRFTSDKRKVLQQLELLIIDEISMVRCDTLDAIDTVLRYIRKRPYERFGGIQLLFIGDMFQLPPVIKETEWKMLSGFYNTPYFFESQVIRDEPLLYIEFDKIYRQSEEKFIRVLNQVRNNQLDEEGLQILESRYQPQYRPGKDDGTIILTTHNEQARNINVAELNKLTGGVFSYAAKIDNDFPSNAYPAEELLSLKEGAQVMFLKNDGVERGKRYYNGKIGTVSRLEEDKIFVQCKDEPYEIEVSSDTWENIRYSLNKTSQTLEEDVLGSFTQFPLRLAWAITIHKSQGLTFEKAVIDAGEAFAPGQVYVALSRCTSLDGLVLKSKLRKNSLFTDPRIVHFSTSISSSEKLQQELQAARKQYQEKILLDSFDFRLTVTTAQSWKELLEEQGDSFNPETTDWSSSVLEKINQLQDTALKFQHWIKGQFQLPGEANQNTVLLERTNKATTHFITEIDGLLSTIQQSPAVTDSKLHAKEYNDTLKEIFTTLAASKYMLQGFNGSIDTESWHLRKKSFVVPGFSVNAYALSSSQKTDTPHPVLYHRLRQLRDSICAKKELAIFMVASGSTLNELVRYLPQDERELLKITGFGEARVDQYGKAFLDIIRDYCAEYDLGSLIHEKSGGKAKRERSSPSTKKTDTYAETLRLYKEGMTIAEIAKARNLTIGTIESHLTRYVSWGDININGLVSREKQLLIEAALKDFTGNSITPVKQQLGSGVSFNEIRWVMAHKGITIDKSSD